MTPTRTCRTCNQEKPWDDFRLVTRKSGEQWRMGICRPCNRTQKRNQYLSKWRGSKKSGAIRITKELYEQMLSRQEGGCAICGRTEGEEGRFLAIDHDHTTGRLRGLLCFACNVAIGHLGDDPDTLQKAVSYLQNNSCESVTIVV